MTAKPKAKPMPGLVAVVGNTAGEVRKYAAANGLHLRDVLTVTPATVLCGSLRGAAVEKVVRIHSKDGAVWTDRAKTMRDSDLDAAQR